ncbi:DivIVA domain-containing protein [Cesiribacter andamanensis]|uniref:Minicell-associated protein DivIVA n=1 Tax=Cesiribacter andamanensis AMV16 TaxID=1279009 RepID=M7N4F3_9BACT|nr:DivIVA domain-containing protein [Cesiribacter andamanensis]EMR02106.1 Minicell-associated protein DivIVA [Cesiribacter andamanensis AMV16]
MKITPLEIRQKTFERNFRGYDKEEVDAFLTTLSQEWERVVEEHKELRYKLEIAEREVSKLRDVESSLFKTLKTAEDTGNVMVEQASKKADLHIREAELKAETILNDARAKARELQDRADDKAEKILQAMERRVKEMEQNYRKLESYRDNLLSDLLVLANNTLERVEQAESKIRKHDLSGLVSAAEQAVRDRRLPEAHSTPYDDEPKQVPTASSRFEEEEPEAAEEQDAEQPSEGKNNSSFFDTI